jgi:glycosyltransferase involved in cell wall biosynthesis
VRFLFIHQNFPAQFLHLLRHLRKSGEHELMFISEPNSNVLPGVRTLTYRMPRQASDETHADAREFEQATLRGEIVAGMAANLKRLGFQPDIIIGHHGWGELLNIQDVYPDTPLLGYFEFYYRLRGSDVGFDPEFPTNPAHFARIRAKNTVNLLALTNGGHGQTPTQWQLSTYPDWAHRQITVVPDGVDLEVCRPDAAARSGEVAIGDITIGPRERLVSYVARNLEPYRGFHVMMRALPALLARRDVRVVMVGGNDVSYGAKLPEGTWRDYMMREVGGRIDLSRVHFPGQVSYEDYLRYPFVASWSLRESLACGCVVIGSDTAPVREFVMDGRTGLLTPCLDPKALAERVLTVLEDQALARRLRAGARSYAEAHLRMQDHLSAYEALISRLTEGEVMPSRRRRSAG